jgi:long-subunit fatty acid transport protein
MRILAAVLTMSLLLVPSAGRAQSTSKGVSKTGTVAAPFLEIPVGAAAVGMGTATVSLMTDPSALYWNPAGSAIPEMSQVEATHMSWIAETRFDFVGLTIPLGGIGTLGVSFTSLSMPDMKVTTVEKPDGTGEYFSAGDIAAGLSFARRLSDRFSVGFTVKYIQQSIWHETASAIALDFGTTFRTDLLGGLVIGASMANFGSTMKLEGRDLRQFISVDQTKLGTNDQVASAIETDSWDLPLQFRIGLSFDPVKVDDHRWTVAVDATHPSDNYEWVNVGTEYGFRECLFFRAGYHSLFLDDAEGGLSLGFGVSSTLLFDASTVVKLDYGYRDMGRIGGVHVVTLGVKF